MYVHLQFFFAAQYYATDIYLYFHWYLKCCTPLVCSNLSCCFLFFAILWQMDVGRRANVSLGSASRVEGLSCTHSTRSAFPGMLCCLLRIIHEQSHTGTLTAPYARQHLRFANLLWKTDRGSFLYILIMRLSMFF